MEREHEVWVEIKHYTITDRAGRTAKFVPFRMALGNGYAQVVGYISCQGIRPAGPSLYHTVWNNHFKPDLDQLTIRPFSVTCDQEDHE